jgi:hypothetical protein
MLVVVEVQLIFFRLTQQQRVLAAQAAEVLAVEMLTERPEQITQAEAVVAVVVRLQSLAAKAETALLS